MNVKFDENDWKNVFKMVCINLFKCGEKGKEKVTGI